MKNVGRGREGEIYGESNMETYITICKKLILPMGICCMSQGSNRALYQPRGVGWEGRWEEVSRGRAHMYT